MASFQAELKDLVASANTQNIAGIFEDLCGRFPGSVRKDVTSMILSAILELFGKKEYVQVFAAGCCTANLPYAPSCDPLLFDILYILARDAPIAFKGPVSRRFGRTITTDHIKTLKIIGIYATHFETLMDPWATIDLLFRHSSAFKQRTSAMDYASLVAGLCRTQAHVGEGRGEIAWKCLLEYISSADDEVAVAGYTGLCALAEDGIGGTRLDPGLEHILIKHMNNGLTRSAVLSLLLRVTPTVRDSRMITSLVVACGEMEPEGKNVYLVLAKIADDRELAPRLVSNTEWMKVGLPTWDNTLTVFGVLMKHDKLRPQIAGKAEIGDLMTGGAKYGSRGFLFVISKLICMLSITDGLVLSLRQKGFFDAYIAKWRVTKSKIEKEWGLTLFGTLALKVNVEPLEGVCEDVVAIAKNSVSAAPTAARVGVVLARMSRKCASQLKLYGFGELLSSSKNPAVKKQFRRFEQRAN